MHPLPRFLGEKLCIFQKIADNCLAIEPCKLPNRGWSLSRGSLTRDYFCWEGMLTVGNDIL